jgi:Zn-dependent membrane protease YugP
LNIILKLQLQNGMSGAEIAEKMLADNGIQRCTRYFNARQLTDHYNPVKTVNSASRFTISVMQPLQWLHMNVSCGATL